MKFVPFFLFALSLCASLYAADSEGSKDHPLIKRFAGSFIGRYLAKDYDEMKFALGKVEFDYQTQDFKPFKHERKEGKRTTIIYALPSGVGTLEVIRNYQNDLKKNGFEVLFEGSGQDEELDDGYDRFITKVYEKSTPDGWMTPFTLTKDFRYLAARKVLDGGGEIWVSVEVAMNTEWPEDEFPKGNAIARLDVIETKDMGDRMVTVKAAEMAEKIGSTGRIALYGILFDFNKADLQPASRPTLEQIAKLLTEEPAMKLLVVGHTDNVGTFEFNRDLSARRAAAVVDSLTKQFGIAPERLFPVGVAFASPVMSNATEEGKAKNRRVELVQY
jgi:OOP family OmpA-OmpF porin